MLAGQLDATQIIAEKPRVLLAINPDDNSWNYHRLVKLRAKRPRPILPSQKPTAPLPEILLRNARLEMSEVLSGETHGTRRDGDRRAGASLCRWRTLYVRTAESRDRGGRPRM